MVKLVTQQRAKQLLETYGSSPEAWPAEEREAAKAFIASSAELKALANEMTHLDQLLDQHKTQSETVIEQNRLEQLSENIMNNLPPQEEEKPDQRKKEKTWIGAIAASLAVAAFTAVLFTNTWNQEETYSQVAASEFDQWAWYETTGEVINNNSVEENIFPLVALAEPELLSE